MPYGVNHRYDLVLDCGDRFVRVQCKTSGLQNGVVKFSVRSVESNMRTSYTGVATKGEVDVFLVYCSDH